MKLSRTMTVLLALIILIKSLNCVIGESVFLGESAFTPVAAIAAAKPLPVPVSPLHSSPMEQGCTDSGCLCKGFVEAPEVVVPEQVESLDDWTQLRLSIARLLPGNQLEGSSVLLLRPGDALFPDTSLSGRSLRHQYASLTL